MSLYRTTEDEYGLKLFPIRGESSETAVNRHECAEMPTLASFEG